MESLKEKQVFVAMALIRNEEGKILLQKRVDVKNPESHGKWEFTGGGIEFGETPEYALQRECKEEIGCTVEIIRLLPCVYSKIWDEKEGGKTQVLICCYEARIIEGVPKPSDGEVSEVRWCNKEEILELDTLCGVKESLKYIE